MELLLALVILLITYFDYWAIQNRGYPRFVCEDLLNALRPKGWKQIAYCVFVPLSIMAVGAMLLLFYEVDAIYVIKRIAVLGLLWPCAVADYREFRIPNKLILLALAAWVVVTVPECILAGSSCIYILINEGIATVGAVVICVICMLVSRGGLGMGDLKLMATMALFMGISGICYALIFSVFVAFVVSVILLITKKKNRKDVIPFAPFILAGTIISLILSGT